jgi:Cu-Zn family superoxide dismutase
MPVINYNVTAPFAYAEIKGGVLAPQVSGRVEFYPAPGGTLVRVDVRGLPPYRPAMGNSQPIGPFGFHIHEGSTCGLGDGRNPFESAMGHYNPRRQPHGNHAGDLPVLFSNGGEAHMQVYTDKFRPRDVVGRTVIIHQNPDDFRTQPAGNSGSRIACGVIERVREPRE